MNNSLISQEMVSFISEFSNSRYFRHDIENSVFYFDKYSLKEMGYDHGDVVLKESEVAEKWGKHRYNYYVKIIKNNFKHKNYKFVNNFLFNDKKNHSIKTFTILKHNEKNELSYVECISSDFYTREDLSVYSFCDEDLRTIINNVGSLLFLVDKDFNIVEYNLVGEKLFGGSVLSLNKKVPLSRFLTIDKSNLESVLKNKNRYDLIKLNIIDIHNNTFVYYFNITPFFSVSRESFAMFNGIDITEIINSEKQLLINEQKFRTIFEQSPYGINLYDKNKNLLDLNAASLRIIGINNKEEVIGFNMLNGLSLSDEEIQMINRGEVCVSSQNLDFTKIKAKLNIKTSRTDVRNIKATISRVMVHNLDNIGYVVILVDKTDEYEAFRNLKRKTEQLSLATSAGKIWIYEINLIDMVYNASSEALYMFEDSNISNSLPFDLFLEKIHPDDLNELLKNIDVLRNGMNDSFSMEFRIKLPTGRWKWIQTSCKVNEYSSDDKLVSVVGINVDIDKIKNAEQEAKEREQLLRQTLVVGEMGLWEYDVTTDVVHLGEYLVESLQLKGSTFNTNEITFEMFISLLCKEDEFIIKEEYHKMLNSNVSSTSIDVRLNKYYNHIWVSLTAFVNRRDKNGKPLFINGFIVNINEKTRALEELKKTKYFLDNALMISKVGYFYVYFRDKQVEISDSCCEIYGLSREEIVSENTFKKYIHQDDYLSYSRFIHVTTNEEFPDNTSIVYRMNINGEMRQIHEYASIHYDNNNKRIGTLYAIQDVTELHEKETQLQSLLDNQRKLSQISIMIMSTLDTNEMINRLLQSIKTQFKADSILFYEKDGKSLVLKKHFNKKAIQCKERIISESDVDFIEEDFSDKNVFFVVKSDKQYEKLSKLFQIRGGLLVFVPVFTQEQITGVIILNIIDVDSYELSYDFGFINNFINLISIAFEKSANERDLIEAKNRAEESDRLKTAFLRNMSHEIRTPLNSIVGFSNLISEQSPPDDEIREYTTVLNRNTEQLLSIVNNVIDFSEIESSEELVKKSIICLNDLCTDVYNKFKTRVSEKVKIRYIYPGKITLINSDKVRLKQILVSLVDNAVKYTKQGEVKFGFNIEEENIIFYVSDTGKGIGKEERDRIFESFYQSDNMTTGTGLGLSIVKAIIHKLEGRIWFESELGVGTTFYISIPK